MGKAKSWVAGRQVAQRALGKIKRRSWQSIGDAVVVVWLVEGTEHCSRNDRGGNGEPDECPDREAIPGFGQALRL